MFSDARYTGACMHEYLWLYKIYVASAPTPPYRGLALLLLCWFTFCPQAVLAKEIAEECRAHDWLLRLQVTANSPTGVIATAKAY